MIALLYSIHEGIFFFFWTFSFRNISKQDFFFSFCGVGRFRRRLFTHTHTHLRTIFPLVVETLCSTRNSQAVPSSAFITRHTHATINKMSASLATHQLSLQAAAAASRRGTSSRRSVAVRAAGFEMPSQYKKVRHGRVLQSSPTDRAIHSLRCSSRQTPDAFFGRWVGREWIECA